MGTDWNSDYWVPIPECEEIKLCDNECPFLDPTEKEQDKMRKKRPHWCHRYNHPLWHKGDHPKINKCGECLKFTKSHLQANNKD